jgi:hypothetical protein
MQCPSDIGTNELRPNSEKLQELLRVRENAEMLSGLDPCSPQLRQVLTSLPPLLLTILVPFRSPVCTPFIGPELRIR